jgi:hypothetical protein
MRTSLVLEKIDFLRGVLNPDTVDGNPGQPGPVYRTAIANYIVAEILRDVGENLRDKALATQVHNIGKELVAESSKGMVTDWDEGDDICPPWLLHLPRPKPGPGPDPNGSIQFFGPHPEPWLDHATPAMNDVVLAIAIQELAALTTHEKTSSALKQVGETIVKDASSRLVDEYCGTRVKPRIPTPMPHRAAA